MFGILPRNSEIFVSLFVLAIALLLLVPLPTFILDLLLVVNLSVAFFLLLVVLYLPNAVQLLAFPTLLLLTTLFRLGLNVASTRLILSQGDAGEVIEAFGTFLVGGELLVGLVVFAIITVINLIVIARGASRISEVAARFALDSLPGKQMSIDADLRAGLISPQEAENRREALRKESQLYGAMDGAMKFVQGDAIAGIVIIFTNIIGGLSLGLFHGMGIQDAVTTYTTLTVGDGLVSQIPAFLIAICAGLVVTRIGTGTETTLGGELQSQLFGQPAVLLVVAGLLFLLSFIEGMPQIPFVIIGIGCLGLWVGMMRSRRFPLAQHDVSEPLLDGEDAPLQLTYERSFTLALGAKGLGQEFSRAAGSGSSSVASRVGASSVAVAGGLSSVAVASGVSVSSVALDSKVSSVVADSDISSVAAGSGFSSVASGSDACSVSEDSSVAAGSDISSVEAESKFSSVASGSETSSVAIGSVASSVEAGTGTSLDGSVVATEGETYHVKYKVTPSNTVTIHRIKVARMTSLIFRIRRESGNIP